MDRVLPVYSPGKYDANRVRVALWPTTLAVLRSLGGVPVGLTTVVAAMPPIVGMRAMWVPAQNPIVSSRRRSADRRKRTRRVTEGLMMKASSETLIAHPAERINLMEWLANLSGRNPSSNVVGLYRDGGVLAVLLA